VNFIDENRKVYGVEPICDILPIAPSVYYNYHAKKKKPELRSQRDKHDEALRPEIEKVWRDNHGVYGAYKVWCELKTKMPVARCTVERLMRVMGLRGARREGFRVTTKTADETKPAPDMVKRQFTAQRPNRLWVADITYVSTWTGFVYVAFVIDVYSRYIVGWRVSTSLHSDLAMDALEPRAART
jgi:transposase InsO family protein